MHTVRHTDEVPRVSPPWHTKPCFGKQAGREHGEPQGVRSPHRCPALLQPGAPPQFPGGLHPARRQEGSEAGGVVGST